MSKRIDVKNLDIYYGDFHAVKDVTMTIQPKAVTAFIGPSGCGKSTFIRTLNRMHEVIPGARVDGHVSTCGDEPVEGRAVDHEIADDRERRRPQRLEPQFAHVAEGPHMLAARRGVGHGAVRYAVDLHAARSTGTLAAVGLVRHGLAARVDDLLVEQVDHVEQRLLRGDPVELVALPTARVFGAGLPPDLDLHLHR